MSQSCMFQVGNGVYLDHAALDQVEIDATGMSPCILAPPQCTSGATYMFWIKLMDTISGAIFTTLDWSAPREGIRFHVDGNGKFQAAIFRAGPDLNRFQGQTNGFHNNINAWQHITVVWKTDPKYEIYLDGVANTVSQGGVYTSSSGTWAARMRMFVGRQYVTYNNNVKTRKMVFDELILFDSPLEATELLPFLV